MPNLDPALMMDEGAAPLPAEQEAPDDMPLPPPENDDEAQAEMRAALASLPAPAQRAAKMIGKVAMADGGERLGQLLQAEDFVNAAATWIVANIQKAEEKVGDIPDEYLYGDGSLADVVCMMVVARGQLAGVEAASDRGAKDAIMDEVERLALGGEGGGQPAEQPEAEPMPEESGTPLLME